MLLIASFGLPLVCSHNRAGESNKVKGNMVDDLKGFNWLNYYGEKFSTSQKRGIFLDTALELVPSDYWRWYLIANAPEGSDSSFTWELFQATVNKDLADVLGNFVNRILRFAVSRYDGKVPHGTPWDERERQLLLVLENKIAHYTEYLEAVHFRRAAAELRAIWVTGNEYVTAAAPWAEIKMAPEKAARSVELGINLIALFAKLAEPIMPEAANRMRSALGFSGPDRWPDGDVGQALKAIAPGTPIRLIEVLFSKIEDASVSEWRLRFGGLA